MSKQELSDGQLRDFQARLDRCAEEGKRFPIKRHEVKAFLSTVNALKERLRLAKEWQMNAEEREAAVCPEDVGFDEHIHSLEKRLADLAPVAQPPSPQSEEIAKEIVRRVCNATLELAYLRHDLTSDQVVMGTRTAKRGLRRMKHGSKT